MVLPGCDTGFARLLAPLIKSEGKLVDLVFRELEGSGQGSDSALVSEDVSKLINIEAQLVGLLAQETVNCGCGSGTGMSGSGSGSASSSMGSGSGSGSTSGSSSNGSGSTSDCFREHLRQRLDFGQRFGKCLRILLKCERFKFWQWFDFGQRFGKHFRLLLDERQWLDLGQRLGECFWFLLQRERFWELIGLDRQGSPPLPPQTPPPWRTLVGCLLQRFGE